MDLNYSPEELAFRDDVRAWLAANLPQELKTAATSPRKADALASHLAKQVGGLRGLGWAAPAGTWCSATSSRRVRLRRRPPIIPFGIHVRAGAALFGTEAQKKLPPRIYNGEISVPGLFQPGFRSDPLPQDESREKRNYVVNGQKTWTSYAHLAGSSAWCAPTRARSARRAFRSCSWT
jgi:alkylation response protein AidB-like acyl-CoA dehydrogenase